jgi:ComF family protein
MRHITFESLIPGIANGLAAAVLAPVCAVCDSILDEPFAGCVCRSCWASITPITPPLCDACGDPLPTAGAPCGCSFTTERWVTRARAIGEYEGTLRAIVHALKYDGRRSLARPLAERMRARGGDLLAAADCVVPVPLHWRRQYQRGFNQARELARHLGLPAINALVRARHTRAQVELAAGERRANVAHAFAHRRCIFGSADISGAKVVLIDDVSTTGATLESCARVLKECHASDVYALTAARVSTPRLIPPTTNDSPRTGSQ